MLHIRLALVFALTSSFGTVQLSAQACTPGRTALVLSGGGVKGLAHIGLLRVLDSLGVTPDLVVGTSMGSVVGALYSSGYSGRELDSLVRRTDIERIFQVYDMHGPQRLRGLSPLVIWEGGAGGVEVQTAAVSEAAVNFMLDAALLRGNLQARGSFDSLVIPFRSVATNLATREATVFAEGDLAQVVRASMAVPVVFEPVEIDGRYFIDGGLSQNVPVAAARSAGATRVIISDVTSGTPDSLNPYSAIAVGEQLINYLFTQKIDTLAGDVYLKTDLSDVGTLDFDPQTLVTVLDAGYRTARSGLADGVCLPPTGAAMSRPMPAMVGAITGDSSDTLNTDRAAQSLGLTSGARFDPVMLRRRLAVLSETQSYQAIWLSPRGADTVSFNLGVRMVPRRVTAVAVAYNNDLGAKLWLGTVQRDLMVHGIEGSAFVFLGQFRKELFLGLRHAKREGSFAVTPTVTAAGALIDVRQFDADGTELPSIPVDQLTSFLGLERRFFGRWSAALGVEALMWNEGGSNSQAAGGRLSIIKSSRNAETRMTAQVQITGVYQRLALVVAPVFDSRRWSIRPYLRAGWGEGLPLQLQFPLGGMAGFPGLHIGERLGDREVDVGIVVRRTIYKPLYLSWETAVGRTAIGGGLAGENGWLVGGRAGLGTETPFGPVSIDYGITEGGRNLLLVSFGQWF